MNTEPVNGYLFINSHYICWLQACQAQINPHFSSKFINDLQVLNSA